VDIIFGWTRWLSSNSHLWVIMIHQSKTSLAQKLHSLIQILHELGTVSSVQEHVTHKIWISCCQVLWIINLSYISSLSHLCFYLVCGSDSQMLNGSTLQLMGTGLPCPTQAHGGGSHVTQPYGTHGTARWRAAPGAHFFIGWSAPDREWSSCNGSEPRPLSRPSFRHSFGAWA
jgi:hypothetical protein